MVDFTLTFDPSISVGPKTAGLKVDGFNLPFAVAFAYSAGTLVVGARPSISSRGDGDAA
jgi:hypothetical protein